MITIRRKGIVKSTVVTIFIIVAFLFITASLTKNIIVKIILSDYLSRKSGFEVNIKDLEINALDDWINISGLEVYNPDGFPDKIMVSIPQIYADYNLSELFKGKIHLRELRINLEELYIVKNKKRELNLNLIKAIQPKEDEIIEENAKKKIHRLQIDLLKIKVGKVMYKNYPVNLPIIIREFNIDIHEQYEDVTDLSALVGVILSKIFLTNVKVGRLVAPDIGEVREELAQALKKATELVPEPGQESKEAPDEDEEKTSENPEKILPLGVK